MQEIQVEEEKRLERRRLKAEKEAAATALKQSIAKTSPNASKNPQRQFRNSISKRKMSQTEKVKEAELLHDSYGDTDRNMSKRLSTVKKSAQISSRVCKESEATVDVHV